MNMSDTFLTLFARAFIIASGVFFILFGIIGLLQGYPILAISIIVGVIFILYETG